MIPYNFLERLCNAFVFFVAFSLVYAGSWLGILGGVFLILATLWALEIAEDSR